MQLKRSFERPVSHFDVIVVVVIPEMFANVVCNVAMLLPRIKKIKYISTSKDVVINLITDKIKIFKKQKLLSKIPSNGQYQTYFWLDRTNVQNIITSIRSKHICQN